MRSLESNLVHEYLENLLQPAAQKFEPWEQLARQNAETFNLAGISLSRAEACLLRWAIGLGSVHKAVEIGTLTGLSGLYILDGLQAAGTLWTLEKNPAHAEKAREPLEAFAKSQGKTVNLVVGDARETLQKIEPQGPFDFIFIDGNKAAYGDYLAWAEKNLVVGGILVGDNILLSGEIGLQQGQKFSKKQIQVMKDFNHRLLNHEMWQSVIIPTSEGLLISKKIKS